MMETSVATPPEVEEVASQSRGRLWLIGTAAVDVALGNDGFCHWCGLTNGG